ncbi:hypothetical protein AAG570_010816 [Ranatra chinensis]|uniref:RNA-directed DNA polymerase n=1 Tax=Ranatra chinensis TaxID=642074 RepID=A0ABD0Z532_9HEMI
MLNLIHLRVSAGDAMERCQEHCAIWSELGGKGELQVVGSVHSVIQAIMNVGGPAEVLVTVIAESRYSTMERELLGVVWVIEHFRLYLFGREFLVRTVHKPLLWVDKLKETSARVTRWKERLAAYTFRITHIRDREYYTRHFIPANFDLSILEDLDREPELVGQPGGGEEPPNRLLRVVITGVNDKRLQLILEETDGTDIETSCHWYKQLVTITMKIGQEVVDTNIWDVVNQIIVPHKEYRVFSRSPRLVGLLEGVYALGRVAAQSTLIRCTRQLQTVEDEQRRREIVEEYHKGPTNHRGLNETIAHLCRTYYWVAMEKTVRDVLGICRVCNRAKYDSVPEITPQQVTPFLLNTLEEVQGGIWYWEGCKVITLLDIATKFAQREEDRVLTPPIP